MSSKEWELNKHSEDKLFVEGIKNAFKKDLGLVGLISSSSIEIFGEIVLLRLETVRTEERTQTIREEIAKLRSKTG